MLKQQSREDILKAFAEYDEGRLTKAGFSEVVERTIEKLYNDAYDDGVNCFDDDEEIELDDAFDEGEPAEDDDEEGL